MENPLVTIIIPSYNRASLIGQTLNSVAGQTYTNWECLIIDDMSTDGTAAMVNAFVEKDNRFKLITRPHAGRRSASISRNIGLNNAKGKYIQFLDSDDLLAGNKISEHVQLLESSPQNCIATCKWANFENLENGLPEFLPHLDFRSFEQPLDYFRLIGKYGGFYPPHVYLLPFDLIKASGFWNESLTMNDDGEFFFRAISNSRSLLFCDTTYVLYRRENAGTNLSHLNSVEKAQSLVDSWKLIEALYLQKYPNDTAFLQKKKAAVYAGLKQAYPSVLYNERQFFGLGIRLQYRLKRMAALGKKIRNRFNTVITK